MVKPVVLAYVRLYVSTVVCKYYLKLRVLEEAADTFL